MRPIIRISLCALMALAMVVSSSAQTNTPVVLRTLGLPDAYSVTDGFIVNEQITRTVEVKRFIDTKNRRKEKVNGKWAYFTDTVYSYSVKEVKGTAPRTYLPNWCSMRKQQPNVYLSQANALSIIQEAIPVTSTDGWVGYQLTTISSDATSIDVITELGYSNNVIRKGSKDVFGVLIQGKDVYNQGATPIYISPSYSNPPVSVSLVTDVLAASGQTFTTKTNGYILRDQLLKLLNKTQEQLEWELRMTYLNEKVNPKTHITSTSAEIVWVADAGKLVLYYNGFDVASNPPTGKITSYGKPYPGVSYQIRLFNGIVNDNVYGTTLTKRFTNTEQKTFTLKAGSAYSFNSNTNTITYNDDVPMEIWGVGVEGVENGKTWQLECEYIEGNGQYVPKW